MIAGRRFALGLVVLVVSGVLATASPAVGDVTPPVTPLGDVPETYLGPPFGPGPPESPTRYEHQGKLWFHDDAWWALMLEPTGTALRIFELRPDHTWAPTGSLININPVDTGDAVSVGDTLYVVSRRADSVVQFVRLAYDRAEHRYRAVTDPPAAVSDRGSVAPASIARDTTGRLWVTFATMSGVVVFNSGDDGATWSEPFPVSAASGPFTAREAAAIASFDDSIGVMWSDQSTGRFSFAVHRDGAAAESWQVETALEGPGLADNHISLKVLDRSPSDAVVAAVKTSQGDQDEPPDSPLVLVLSRTPDGTWSRAVAGTVADSLNSAVLQIDATNAMVYLAAHRNGTVYVKKSPLDRLEFPPGPGRPLISGGATAVVDAAGSNQPLDARTGLVVLASGSDRRYRHAELRIPGPLPAPEVPDVRPPDPPTGLIGTATAGAVTLLWSASGDGERWSAAADRFPVRGYVVLRDGREIGRTDQLSFADAPAPGRDHTYAVVAVDFSDNRSAPASVTVAVAEEAANGTQVIAWVLLAAGLAGAVALVAVRRLRARL